MFEIYDEQGEITQEGKILRTQIVECLAPLLSEFSYYSSELAYFMQETAEDCINAQQKNTNLKNQLTPDEILFLKELEGLLDDLIKKYQVQLRTPINKEEKQIPEIEF